eukprot:gene8445-17413_t
MDQVANDKVFKCMGSKCEKTFSSSDEGCSPTDELCKICYQIMLNRISPTDNLEPNSNGVEKSSNVNVNINENENCSLLPSEVYHEQKSNAEETLEGSDDDDNREKTNSESNITTNDNLESGTDSETNKTANNSSIQNIDQINNEEVHQYIQIGPSDPLQLYELLEDIHARRNDVLEKVYGRLLMVGGKPRRYQQAFSPGDSVTAGDKMDVEQANRSLLLRRVYHNEPGKARAVLFGYDVYNAQTVKYSKRIYGVICPAMVVDQDKKSDDQCYIVPCAMTSWLSKNPDTKEDRKWCVDPTIEFDNEKLSKAYDRFLDMYKLIWTPSRGIPRDTRELNVAELSPNPQAKPNRLNPRGHPPKGKLSSNSPAMTPPSKRGSNRRGAKDNNQIPGSFPDIMDEKRTSADTSIENGKNRYTKQGRNARKSKGETDVPKE